MKTVTIKALKGALLQADIYPASGPDLGTILYLHSGGLIFGSRHGVVQKHVELYGRAGFSVVAADYRLAPESKLPEIVADVQASLGWIRAHGEAEGLNVGNLFVVGASAGGYLALLTGLLPERPKAIVSFYGYGDILADWYASPSEYYLRLPPVSKAEAYSLVGTEPTTRGSRARFGFYIYCRQRGVWVDEVVGGEREHLLSYCPLQQADGQFPPTFLLHGDQDVDVPFAQSVLMHRRLRDLGVESRLMPMVGRGHLFDLEHGDPEVQDALEQVVTFLKGQVQA